LHGEQIARIILGTIFFFIGLTAYVIWRIARGQIAERWASVNTQKRPYKNT